MDGVGAEAVIFVIMEALIGNCGNLKKWNEVTRKLVSFGVDGASIFQGHRTDVIAHM